MLDRETNIELANIVNAASADRRDQLDSERRDSKYSRLRDSVPLFEGLSVDDVRRIMHRGNISRVPERDVIFYRDTAGSDMFVVLSGRVGIYGEDEHLLAELGVGDMFGEMSLLMGKPRNATVIAHENTKLFVMRKETFEKLLTKRVAVKILENISRVLCSRIDTMNKRYLGERS